MFFICKSMYFNIYPPEYNLSSCLSILGNLTALHSQLGPLSDVVCPFLRRSLSLSLCRTPPTEPSNTFYQLIIWKDWHATNMAKISAVILCRIGLMSMERHFLVYVRSVVCSYVCFCLLFLPTNIQHVSVAFHCVGQ